MIDESDFMVAYVRNDKGGARQSYKYAKKVKKIKIINLVEYIKYLKYKYCQHKKKRIF